jgi:hypothetical protein
VGTNGNCWGHFSCRETEGQLAFVKAKFTSLTRWIKCLE